ncbi:hypothetical protein FNZ56_04055 [Pseudoluteimonas lycopersici]|uniref:Uncharacterized protein n=1 Tax=Pseudoluteimonas lycopersici TaxID=1324796 RepID=A0A516V3K9_9GAMM|nr:hypothetical protein [Lysobacter lycopersici]QDQ73105.1 hypothetical protein FNZ56_04055 [Lysobacter lycopersici]
MNVRNALLAIAAVCLSVACAHRPFDETPYSSDDGFSFQVYDGTGTFDSKTKTYKPLYCGTEYPERRLDIGQAGFDAVKGLVDAGDLWSAKVAEKPDCRGMDPAPNAQFFHFQKSGKSQTLVIEQCEEVAAQYRPYLAAIKQIVRGVSDQQTLHVQGECVRI